MTRDRLLLGIDGGGSGCRAVVADARGRVLGTGTGGPANIVSDPDGSLAAVTDAARGAMAAAGAGEDLSRLVAVLGLAGANVTDAAAAFRARLPFGRARVENDVVIAARGALGAGDGIVASLGTGSVYALQRAGRMRLAGGWGIVLGDHGSGARIGRDLYEAAVLAHDGFVPMTPLLAETLAEGGGVEAIVALTRHAVPAVLAAVAPRVLARPDDPAAARILADADAAIVRALDHLEAGGKLPIVFTGGLGPVFAARLASRYAGLVRPAQGSALDGALALARDLLPQDSQP